MTLNPFYGNVLFQCPLKSSGNLWFSDVFLRKYRKRPVPGKGLFITEHAFSQSVCTGSFNTPKRYKISVFSEIKLISRNTFQWLLPVNVHCNQLKQ